MRIAVDIGFGFIKSIGLDKKDEQNKSIQFPSVIVKRPEKTLRGIVGGSGDDYAILYKEKEKEEGKDKETCFFVGDSAIVNGGTRKWKDKNEFNLEDIKIFIATAINVVAKDAKSNAIDLVLGLPLSYYIMHKDNLMDTLKDEKIQIKFENETKYKTIEFNSIFVFPQGAGAYYASIYNLDGTVKNFEILKNSVGILDIGYRTVDYLVMGKGRKGISIVDNLSGSLEEDGMNKVYQSIQEQVCSELEKEIDLLKFEQAILWFDDQLNFKSKIIDLKKYRKDATKTHAEKISSKIKLKWSSEIDTLSNIIITGGGGKEVFDNLKINFDQATLQENSSFANCEGFLGAQVIMLKNYISKKKTK